MPESENANYWPCVRCLRQLYDCYSHWGKALAREMLCLAVLHGMMVAETGWTIGMERYIHVHAHVNPKSSGFKYSMNTHADLSVNKQTHFHY